MITSFLMTFTSGFSIVQQVPGWTEDGVWLGDAKNRHGNFGEDSSTPVLVIVVNRFLLLRQREAAGVPRF